MTPADLPPTFDLFVGGPADGDRTAPDPDSTHRIVSVGRPVGPTELAGRPIAHVQQTFTAAYAPMVLEGNQTTFRVWVPADWTPDDGLRELLAGYTPKRPRKR